MIFLDFVDIFTPSAVVVYLNIIRQSSGIIYRLAVPIMLLLLLVGLTFWSEYNGRMNTTITILLAISALYIVIFQSIPMLGYLTDFDVYIITMFLMIILAIFLHQICCRLHAKADRYPLRMIALRIIEISGKVFVIPCVLISFFWTFKEISVSREVLDTITALCICASGYILLREANGFKQDTARAMKLLSIKLSDSAESDVKLFELLVFNYYSYGVASTSIRYFHEQQRSRPGAGTEVCVDKVPDLRASMEVEMQARVVQTACNPLNDSVGLPPAMNE